MNKELEEAIKSLKKVSNAKSGCSYEIALFDFGEHAETVLKELERLQEENKNSIHKNKIREKLEEYNNILMSCNKFSDIDRIKAINERVLELKELLE